MIFPKELRVGNLVNHSKYDDKTYFTLRGVCDHRIHPIELIDEVGYAIQCELSDLNPIALTTEILEKCGFKKGSKFHPFSYSRNIGALTITLYQPDKIWYGYFSEIYLGDLIQDVHTLQNFYFTWMKSELNVHI